MSRISGGSMLRTRRRDASIKPNRRLDRKSSRGMIYENEELRLRTININAEVERGQSDIKKLRRENEQLRREIWSLRDEYDRLDKIIRGQNDGPGKGAADSSRSGTASDSEDSCDQSCAENEPGDQESAENDENAQKTKQKGLHVNFDHLSIVSEENTNSDCNSAGNTETALGGPGGGPGGGQRGILTSLSTLEPLSNYEYFDPTSESTTTGETVLPNGWDFSNAACRQYASSYKVIGVDSVCPTDSNIATTYANAVVLNDFKEEINSYPVRNIAGVHPDHRSFKPTVPIKENPVVKPKHFFAPIRSKPQRNLSDDQRDPRAGPDVFVNNILAYGSDRGNVRSQSTTSSFQTGGNLEDLLMDIESISNDILHLQAQSNADLTVPKRSAVLNASNFRSEINVVLRYPQDVTPSPPLPEPMELLPNKLPYFGIGFENITTPSTLQPLDYLHNVESHKKSLQKQTSMEFPSSITDKIVPFGSTPAFPTDAFSSIIEISSIPYKEHGVPDEFAMAQHGYASPHDFPPSSPMLGGERQKMSTVSITSETTAQNIKNAEFIHCSNLTNRKSSFDKTKTGTFTDAHTPPTRLAKLALQNEIPRPDSPVPHSILSKDGTGLGNSLQRNESFSSSSDRNEKLDIPRSPASIKKKNTRRVSIYFNGKKSDVLEKEQKSISRSHSEDGSKQCDGQRDVKNRLHSHDSAVKGKTDSKKSQNSRPSPEHYYSKGGKHKSCTKGGEFAGGYGSMYSTQESCAEPTTSHSERNSLASSRESSTSLSLRSQKSRKMSTSSAHTGSIPWCGCWGNGCL